MNHDFSDHFGYLVRDVDWEFYEQTLRDICDRRIFTTFDRNRIEVMRPSWKHERYAELFGLLIRIIATELKLPLISGGSTTFRSRQAEAGLEPDRCFYIQHANSVTGKREVDLAVGPPPDLVIEIEVSRRIIDRLELYARLAIAEIWRCDGKRLEVLLLNDEGYRPSVQSAAFPRIAIGQIVSLVEQSWLTDETTGRNRPDSGCDRN